MIDRKALRRARLMHWLRGGAAVMVLVAQFAPSFAQTVKPALKPLDVFDLQWVSDPQISPDGRSIAYVRMAYDIKTDRPRGVIWLVGVDGKHARPDRKSTRLNSSHTVISYAVFCLKKKK